MLDLRVKIDSSNQTRAQFMIIDEYQRSLQIRTREKINFGNKAGRGCRASSILSERSILSRKYEIDFVNF